MRMPARFGVADGAIEATCTAVGKSWVLRGYLGSSQMPMSAAIETNARMPLTKISIAGCMRFASGIGGGGPG